MLSFNQFFWSGSQFFSNMLVASSKMQTNALETNEIQANYSIFYPKPVKTIFFYLVFQYSSIFSSIIFKIRFPLQKNWALIINLPTLQKTTGNGIINGKRITSHTFPVCLFSSTNLFPVSWTSQSLQSKLTIREDPRFHRARRNHTSFLDCFKNRDII